MLAQNFKTAADLGLKEDQHRALVTVLGMMERGEVPHNKLGDHVDFAPVKNTPVAFNMYHVYAEAECGTVCCLAGWAEFVGRLPAYSLFNSKCSNDPLSELFDPYFGPDFSTRNITPTEAAMALRSFLTTGEPDWEAAVGAPLTNGRRR